MLWVTFWGSCPSSTHAPELQQGHLGSVSLRCSIRLIHWALHSSYLNTYFVYKALWRCIKIHPRWMKFWYSTISCKPTLWEIFYMCLSSRASFRLEVTNSHACRGLADNISEWFWLDVKQLWPSGWERGLLPAGELTLVLKGQLLLIFQPIVFPCRNAGWVWPVLKLSQEKPEISIFV